MGSDVPFLGLVVPWLAPLREVWLLGYLGFYKAVRASGVEKDAEPDPTRGGPEASPGRWGPGVAVLF